MVSLADDDSSVRKALDRAGRYWKPKPEGWDEPLGVDGICGYVSDVFLPCELPKGHDGPHTHVALASRRNEHEGEDAQATKGKGSSA